MIDLVMWCCVVAVVLVLGAFGCIAWETTRKNQARDQWYSANLATEAVAEMLDEVEDVLEELTEEIVEDVRDYVEEPPQYDEPPTAYEDEE